MSNERFSEEDLAKKGYVKDGDGNWSKPVNQKRIALTHGSARVDENVSPKTIAMLNKLSEIAYTKTPMLDKALKQAQQREKFNPKTALFAKGRLKKGVMNKTEATYAKHLEALKFSGEIAWFGFERITIKLANDTRLTPDFAIMYNDGSFVFHDVKGSKFIFQDDAKVKMKVAAETIPFRFFVVYPRTQKMGGGFDTHEINADKPR